MASAFSDSLTASGVGWKHPATRLRPQKLQKGVTMKIFLHVRIYLEAQNQKKIYIARLVCKLQTKCNF